MEYQDQVDAYINLFNNLHHELNRDAIRQLTDAQIRFVDPFNDVTGQPAFEAVLNHFRHQVEHPHFEIQQIAWSGRHYCLLRWEFSGRLKRLGWWQFPGVSEISLNDQGQILMHRDHWDAGQFFYMKLPLVGSLLRWIRYQIQRQSAKS